MYVNYTHFFRRGSSPSKALFKLLHMLHNIYAFTIDFSLYFVRLSSNSAYDILLQSNRNFVTKVPSSSYWAFLVFLKFLDGIQKQVMISVIPIATNP
jgi:hypothetical protein